MWKSKILKISFKESIKSPDLIDGIIAIAYYFYIMLIIYIFGLLMFRTNVSVKLKKYFTNKNFCKLVLYIPITILELFPIFLVIKIRKQPVSSIGIMTEKNLKSIILGIIFSLPFILPTIIYGIPKYKNTMNISDLILLFVYFFVHIAFVEEISYRGFIQTRILGLIKNKWVSIVVVGIMFSLMHIPFQMIQSNMSFKAFIAKDSVNLIFICLIHIYLVYLYTRDNNILSTTITHTLIDFIGTIFM